MSGLAEAFPSLPVVQPVDLQLIYLNRWRGNLLLSHRIHINRVAALVLQDRSHAPSVVSVVEVIQIADT